ncbi:MAG: hypothetical protein IH872_06050 [Chloroflexi bacterium]|nr:hypothetical protein [Chloroflexota bacterium]
MKSHADKHQEPQIVSRSRAVANHSAHNKHAASAEGILDDHRPESLQLKMMQLMADSSPQADDFAQLQAMGDGEDGLPVENRPESLQLKRTQLMADSSPQAKGVAQLMPPKANAGRTVGNPIGILTRWGTNGVLDYFGGYGFRYHHYQSPIVPLGRINQNFNAAFVYRALMGAPIWFTVPGAIRPQNGVFLGPREQGGRACAWIGGPVLTTGDSASLILVNEVQRGHLFGGIIRQQIWEENGYVVTRVVGEGYGNFARINEIAGVLMFSALIKHQMLYLYVTLVRRT